MQSYSEALEYLYSRLPMFTREGASAYKKDLDRTLTLCQSLDNPHKKIKCIHIAGTNGKGSSSHMLAGILSANGYKTGLYTSPHLLDFRERIRVGGKMVDQSYVLDFVNRHQDLIEKVRPSFFEVTVAMAFDYFVQSQVDIAVIETGLGGRLDSTNIIEPIASLITNIGMDHSDILGSDKRSIAFEKAGIIKKDTPIVISEHDIEVDNVFIKRAKELGAPLVFGEDEYKIVSSSQNNSYLHLEIEEAYDQQQWDLSLDLRGTYQAKNVLGVLSVIKILIDYGLELEKEITTQALQNIQGLTGMLGRWQIVSSDPLIICDTGHNEHGFRQVVQNINTTPHKRLQMVIGMMKDKDIDSLLSLMPKEAEYYFCQPDMPRALAAKKLKMIAERYGLDGEFYNSIEEAIDRAVQEYTDGGLIFIGGSTFVVAEALAKIL